MEIRTRNIIKAAALIGALATICGAVYGSAPTVRGVYDSGPLPLAGKDYVDQQVAALTNDIQSIQKQNAAQSATDSNNTKMASFALQTALEGELKGAEGDAKAHPSNAANQYVCSLIQQINQLRPVNRLPKMPVPPICFP